MTITRNVAFAALPLLLIACQHSSKDGSGKASTSVVAAKPVGEHANPPFAGVREMMRAKLAHAQAVLEGVARQDFDQVQTNASALHNLSTLSDWQVHRTMEYNQYSEDFRWTAREREARAFRITLRNCGWAFSAIPCPSTGWIRIRPAASCWPAIPRR